MKHWRTIIALSTVFLSGCSSDTVKNTLGLDRAAPDEFRVVSRPPLSVPPQFTLRPPANSDAAPNQASASSQAQSVILGGKASDSQTGSVDSTAAPVKITKTSNGKTPASGTSSADAAFLRDAGANQADPKIRDTLMEERYARQEQTEDTPWWDFWSSSNDKKEPLVDPKKESDRIKKDSDSGQPVTNGDTPEIKDRDTGLIGRIFGY